MRLSGAARCVAVLLAASGLASCNVSQLQFRNDKRLTFTTPKDRAFVTAPLTIAWTMRGFTPAGLDGSSSKRSGAFAVFVDRAPMPVGKDLRWVARNDAGCMRDPRCPDKRYLADVGVHVTTEDTLTLSTIPALDAGVGNEQHYVNIVLVDGTGHRIGESSWYLPFTSERRSTS